MGAIRLTTTLQKRGPAAAVVLDDEQAHEIGEGAKRFPVAATINGYSCRTTVVRMGGEFLVGMPARSRTRRSPKRATVAWRRRSRSFAR